MQNNQPSQRDSDSAIAVREQWSGPLPSPRDLAEFDRVIPGAAERILAQFEKQAAHRMSIEWRVVRSKTWQSNMGSVFGFGIGTLGLWVAKEVAMSGQGAASAIIAAVDLVGLVSVFVIGRRQEAGERKQRRMERSRVTGKEEPEK